MFENKYPYPVTLRLVGVTYPVYFDAGWRYLSSYFKVGWRYISSFFFFFFRLSNYPINVVVEWGGGGDWGGGGEVGGGED